MTKETLVLEIDWLISNFPGYDSEAIYDRKHEYALRLKNILAAEDISAARVVSRCLTGDLFHKGYTLEKLIAYWDSTPHLEISERLYNFRSVDWGKV